MSDRIGDRLRPASGWRWFAGFGNDAPGGIDYRGLNLRPPEVNPAPELG
jgi:hypothetical protein